MAIDVDLIIVCTNLFSMCHQLRLKCELDYYLASVIASSMKSTFIPKLMSLISLCTWNIEMKSLLITADTRIPLIGSSNLDSASCD